MEREKITDDYMHLNEIIYQNILSIFDSILILYSTKELNDDYSLRKDYKPQKTFKYTMPIEFTQKHGELDINNIISIRYLDVIKNFINVLIDNFNVDDLANFYNNIMSLKISHKENFFLNIVLHAPIVAEYDIRKNSIVFNDDIDKAAIYHELFHMASTKHKDDLILSGFFKITSKFGMARMGYGINEGYTEFLAKKYFSSFVSPDDHSYEYHVSIAEKIEQIVGINKMQSLYLTADLNGLIDELCRFVSREEVISFISNTDFLFNHMHSGRASSIEKGKILNSLKHVNAFLITSYSRKLQDQVDDCVFETDDGVVSNLSKYIYSLPIDVKTRKNKFQVTDEKSIKEFIEDFSENIDMPFSSNKKRGK